jgi:hypothetical protein
VTALRVQLKTFLYSGIEEIKNMRNDTVVEKLIIYSRDSNGDIK